MKKTTSIQMFYPIKSNQKLAKCFENSKIYLITKSLRKYKIKTALNPLSYNYQKKISKLTTIKTILPNYEIAHIHIAHFYNTHTIPMQYKHYI